jgi:hypothetical protein
MDRNERPNLSLNPDATPAVLDQCALRVRVRRDSVPLRQLRANRQARKLRQVPDDPAALSAAHLAQGAPTR